MAEAVRDDDPEVMFPDELQVYIEENREGSYTLLDVRQPNEYEEAHLPGAFLVPLPRLAESTEGLDPETPTIVYCAVGGRSRMAGRLLLQQGFKKIYHLQGGIEAWEAPTALGPVDFHLGFIRGDETLAEIVTLAYGMEEGLKRFHESMRSRTEDQGLIDLLNHLVKAEEGHERALIELYSGMSAQEEKFEEMPSAAEAGLMEGGYAIEQFMKENEPFMQNVVGYLNLAMMIETQALDLYLRMAAWSKDKTVKQALLRIGDEEKAHLALLGRMLDEWSESRAERAPVG